MSHTLWSFNIAMENGYSLWIFPLKIMVFHTYVKLPEGKSNMERYTKDLRPHPGLALTMTNFIMGCGCGKKNDKQVM